MSKILEIHPNNAGGQLKFRIDSIDCRVNGDDEPLLAGTTVDIYLLAEGLLAGLPRDCPMETINNYNLSFGRPKGYGTSIWGDGVLSRIMWTPFIGDEGYFADE